MWTPLPLRGTQWLPRGDDESLFAASVARGVWPRERTARPASTPTPKTCASGAAMGTPPTVTVATLAAAEASFDVTSA